MVRLLSHGISRVVVENQLLLRFANVGLRGATVVGKLLLVFVLATYLGPSDVGIYGLLSATIFFVLMALGFDFYTYATRELIVADRREWIAFLRDQAAFYCIMYGIVLPICLVIFSLGFLPWHLAAWFFPLVIFEHLLQEFNRLLVAMSEPVWASLVLFTGTGVWTVLVAVWMWVEPAQRSLDFVFASWLGGLLLACLIAISRLRLLPRGALSSGINWPWIRHGVSVASPFLIASLSLRALFTLDRYWLEALSNLEVVGAYVLFAGVGSAIRRFLDAAVFTFNYPALVAAAGRNDRGTFINGMRRLTFQTICVSLGLAAVGLLAARLLVVFLGDPVYTENLHLLYWILPATVLYGLSMIPHYGLYAQHYDRPIIISQLVSLIIFCVSVPVLHPILKEAAIPAAMLVAFSFLLVIKSVALRRCERSSMRSLSSDY